MHVAAFTVALSLPIYDHEDERTTNSTHREKGRLSRKAHIWDNSYNDAAMIACALTAQLEGAKQCSGRIAGNPEVIPRTACEVALSVNRLCRRVAGQVSQPHFQA